MARVGVRGAKNPWRKRLFPGLAARVYLVCAGQLVAVACALYVLSNYAFDSHARGDFARFARPALEESLDAAAVRSPERLGALARELGARLGLVISDVVMPRLNGRELARQLALEHPQVRVLFVSGYSDAALSAEGVLDPGVQLLRKPFTIDALLRRVEDLLVTAARA